MRISCPQSLFDRKETLDSIWMGQMMNQHLRQTDGTPRETRFRFLREWMAERPLCPVTTSLRTISSWSMKCLETRPRWKYGNRGKSGENENLETISFSLSLSLSLSISLLSVSVCLSVCLSPLCFCLSLPRTDLLFLHLKTAKQTEFSLKSSPCGFCLYICQLVSLALYVSPFELHFIY